MEKKRVWVKGVGPKRGWSQRGVVKIKRNQCMVLLLLLHFAAFVLGEKLEQNFTLRTWVSYWKTGKTAVF